MKNLTIISIAILMAVVFGACSNSTEPSNPALNYLDPGDSWVGKTKDGVLKYITISNDTEEKRWIADTVYASQPTYEIKITDNINEYIIQMIITEEWYYFTTSSSNLILYEIKFPRKIEDFTKHETEGYYFYFDVTGDSHSSIYITEDFELMALKFNPYEHINLE